MLKNIEDVLLPEQITPADINNSLKQLLMSVNNKTAKPSSDHHESDVHDNELRKLNETIQVVRKEKQIRHSIQSQESDIKGILTDFMKSVSEQILELKYELKEHVKKTSAQMEELKDITCGLKKHHSLCCNDISSKMQDVAEESESVKTQMSVLNEELLKRFQSFTDSIKTQLSAITDHKKENHHSTQNKDQSSNNENTNDSSSVVSEIQKTPNKDQRSSQTVTRQTLIIGDSILKGINKSGLKTDVDVLTCPGKKLNEIQSNLSREIATK
ncbi:hypothetical protein DPMN_178129 [Dreissena polymorpha]|uniref:Uncharacterized protein n=1 Tax=Dreissena polymorpha TaxID=45954 RepID=A0A9D4ECA9_DREPO|nr:hypothetical protein DPMN_178129 [Dreissena polymorpha]